MAYKYAHPDSLGTPKAFLTIPTEPYLSLDILSIEKDDLILYTNYKAKNYQLIYQKLGQPNQINVLVPEKNDAMIEAYNLDKYVLCLYMKKGRQYCILYDKKGNIKLKLDFPEGNAVDGFRSLTNNPDIVSYELNSFYHNEVTFQMDIGKLKSEPIYNLGVNYDSNDFVTKVITYFSKDSVEVPMYITYKKDIKLDGNNPTLLYAYGGFGVSLTPFFRPSNILFLENGGILAVPNIRGGGELGSEWHQQGSGLNKQNSFNDFIFAAKYLIEKQYTSAQKLAIRGGSNGGLLVASVLCQTPELFKAVVAENGLYDMLRYQHFTAGDFWGNEYGLSTNEQEFNNLYSYSPLHTLKEDLFYPATLVVTGDNDDRVTPLHSYKFLATLQEKGKMKNPFVLFIEKKSGHSSSELLNTRYQTESFIVQFIFDQLGMDLN